MVDVTKPGLTNTLNIYESIELSREERRKEIVCPSPASIDVHAGSSEISSSSR
jgi:hypothetical protein